VEQIMVLPVLSSHSYLTCWRQACVGVTVNKHTAAVKVISLRDGAI